MASILIVGSVAWDEVVRLDAPLRPGAHNGGRWVGKRIGGGAANTGMALLRAGDRVLLVSAVGDDPDGERLLSELARMGFDTHHLDSRGAATTRSLVMLDETGERTIITLARARVPLPPALASIPADCLYVRSADPALTPVLAKRARQGMVVAHVPPLQEGALPAQVLVASSVDLDADFLADPFAAGRYIAGDLLEWMVVTQGAEGARAFGPGGKVLTCPAPPLEVVDTTGAGDVFAGGLCYALARGADMHTALETAVAWGTASVGYEGTVPPPGFPRSSWQ